MARHFFSASDSSSTTVFTDRSWLAYCADELDRGLPLLRRSGFRLDAAQVHLGGERFLTAAVRKLVLTGERERDGMRVVMKISSREDGIREIEQERSVRALLEELDFTTSGVFWSQEIFFEKRDGFTISATSYIEQDLPFTDRSLDQQFTMAVRGLDAQSAVQLRTHPAAAAIESTLGVDARPKYLASFAGNCEVAKSRCPERHRMLAVIHEASELFTNGASIAAPYLGFLTHTDFVPHNFRISDRKFFLLDLASIRIGNKHESWARFVNNALFSSRDLEQAMIRRVRVTEGEAAYANLRLMRIYKGIFLLQIFARSLDVTTGNLHLLCEKRVTFWTEILAAILADMPVAAELVADFVRERDALRSAEEYRRRERM
ncbi:MAG: hypothetical protein M3N49_02730 [Candidatus Eremiobacteraeota bacterium]|nr:hypothetical protein [Candidatus Eremiobacteraeota bacterium]